MKTYPVSIEVEADRTCSVRASSRHGLEMGHRGGKITGLTPEQATILKNELEDAYRRGWFDRAMKLRTDLATQVELAPE